VWACGAEISGAPWARAFARSNRAIEQGWCSPDHRGKEARGAFTAMLAE